MLTPWRESPPSCPNRAFFLLFLVSLGGCASQPTARPSEPDVRIIAFGGSTTRGPAGADYTAFLPSIINLPAETIANEGLSGETTDAGLRRLSALIDRAIFPNADALIYWQGGNDLINFIQARDPALSLFDNDPDPAIRAEFDAELDRITANISTAATEAAAAGWAVFVVTYYPPAAGLPCPLTPLGFLLPADASAVHTYVDALNARVRSVAAEAGATLVDVASIGETLLDNPFNYFDCNHLSLLGNALVAEEVATALRPALLDTVATQDSP